MEVIQMITIAVIISESRMIRILVTSRFAQ